MLRKRIKIHRLSKTKRYIIILFLCMLSITFAFSFGRYVYTKVIDLYFMTKNFYFESDKLKNPQATYSMNYWNGVDYYDIDINLNSFKNDILKSNSDITYNIRYECPQSIVTCSLSKSSGTISGNTNTDLVTFRMTPVAVFNDNDSVTFRIIAEATSPYQKTLSASFTLIVGKYGLSHVIEDAAGQAYLNLKVTNTLDSYIVKEDFGTYTAGNHISKAVYDSLSATDKEKCASAIINVSFNPNDLRIDNTNKDFMNAYNIQTSTISGYNYVRAFTFDMDSSVSNVIKFYKKNKSNNYSGTNAITVNYSY